MNRKKRSEVIKDVRLAIDQAEESVSMGDIDEDFDVELDDVIWSKVEDGINAVRLVAPLMYVETASKVCAVGTTSAECGDMLRFVSINCPGWHDVITSVSEVGSADYERHFSEFAGISNYTAIVENTNGVRLVKWKPAMVVSAGALRYVVRSKVIAPSDAVDEPSVDVEEALYRAYVLKVASLVAGTFGQSDLATLLNTMCAEQMGMS